nr:MAG TPA: hypothetical protein [Caudoviricetes sp.]
MVMLLGVTDIVILLYRTTHPRIYLRITKTVKIIATPLLVLFPLVVVHIVVYSAALPY